MTQQLDDWNTRNIKEFRDSGGKIAQFGDAPVLLLTHTGDYAPYSGFPSATRP